MRHPARYEQSAKIRVLFQLFNQSFLNNSIE